MNAKELSPGPGENEVGSLRRLGFAQLLLFPLTSFWLALYSFTPILISGLLAFLPGVGALFAAFAYVGYFLIAPPLFALSFPVLCAGNVFHAARVRAGDPRSRARTALIANLCVVSALVGLALETLEATSRISKFHWFSLASALLYSLIAWVSDGRRVGVVLAVAVIFARAGFGSPAAADFVMVAGGAMVLALTWFAPWPRRHSPSSPWSHDRTATLAFAGAALIVAADSPPGRQLLTAGLRAAKRSAELAFAPSPPGASLGTGPPSTRPAQHPCFGGLPSDPVTEMVEPPDTRERPRFPGPAWVPSPPPRFIPVSTPDASREDLRTLLSSPSDRAVARNSHGIRFLGPDTPFRQQACAGDAAAVEVLRRMYEDGRGVPKDNVEALMWANIGAERAAAADRSRRDEAIARLRDRVKPEERAEADERSRAWLAAFERQALAFRSQADRAASSPATTDRR